MSTSHRIDRQGSATPSSRLVSVELRKIIDTRAGFWLLTVTGLGSVAAVILRLGLGSRTDRTFEHVYLYAQTPLCMLLPVIAILLVTGEWSQRTALTTFTLVPRRSKVIEAKLDALATLAIGGWFAALGASAAGFAAGKALDRTSGGWSLPFHMIQQVWIAQLSAVLIGAAFGLLLRSTAAAVVVYLVIPTAWTFVAKVIPGISGVSKWLDCSTTTDWLLKSKELTGQQWAQLGTSMALWCALPMLIGLWRLSREEIS